MNKTGEAQGSVMEHATMGKHTNDGERGNVDVIPELVAAAAAEDLAAEQEWRATVPPLRSSEEAQQHEDEKRPLTEGEAQKWGADGPESPGLRETRRRATRSEDIREAWVAAGGNLEPNPDDDPQQVRLDSLVLAIDGIRTPLEFAETVEALRDRGLALHRIDAAKGRKSPIDMLQVARVLEALNRALVLNDDELLADLAKPATAHLRQLEPQETRTGAPYEMAAHWGKRFLAWVDDLIKEGVRGEEAADRLANWPGWREAPDRCAGVRSLHSTHPLRMPALRTWCRDHFPDTPIETARGILHCLGVEKQEARNLIR